MGIGNLNALKPWDQPSDYGYDTNPLEFRSVVLTETVELTDNDRQFASNEENDNPHFFLLDDEGGYFFVRLEGYPEGGLATAVTDEDDGVAVPTGFLAVVTANNESEEPLSVIPLGSYILLEYGVVVDANLELETYASEFGVAANLVSVYGAMFNEDVPGHFITSD